jgi:hypothetical protein
MPCAYLYVNNFFSASLAWNVRGGSPQRAQSTQRKAEIGGKATANGTAFNAEFAEIAEGAEKGGDWGRARNAWTYVDANGWK